MKTKIPILIVAGLFLATVSKAQYAAPCYHPRVIVQSPAIAAYDYNYPRRFRGDEYEVYCRNHRDYRGGREAFYRDRYRAVPYCAPRRVVVYR